MVNYIVRWLTINSEPSETSKLEPFAEIVNGFNPLIL